VRILRFVVLTVGFIALTGCRPQSRPGQPADVAVRAFVTLLPQVDFVQRIGGRHVRVGVLVGPGQSHHSYEPTPNQIAELSESRVYFRIGVPLEDSLLSRVKASAPSLRIVDTREGVKLLDFEGCGDDGDHVHANHGAQQKDPHIWLDPRLVAIQAGNICRALCEIDSAHTPEYRARLASFESELKALGDRISRKLAPLAGRDMVVFHPAYGYFAAAYGLKQVAIEDAGKEPTGKLLASLIDRSRRANTRVIFVQPQFAYSSAQTVANAIGARVVELDPSPRDYIRDMDRMASIVADGLGGEDARRSQLSSNAK
jgi:zinc transport system substrate-binding protein